ncbi:hypothetical protein ANN_09568 [Periplaneta americana]|uniref:Uncharacterized protein n=1 Tax=Periplaneta americana TaxID=6978 RepID=A0ABQ8TN57_PERAM|nr:hypothetical protein ANN_09568 [Periplaneta americana]
MIRYSFQEQAEMVFVYGQAGGNGREAAHTLTDSTTHITQHLEPFFGVCVSVGPLRQTNVQGRRLCVHQMWRNIFSMILRTTLVQAPDK